MTRALLVLVAAVVIGCAGPAPSRPVETAVVALVMLPVAPGTGLGPGPDGGCGSVAFADLRLRGDPNLVPAVWLETLDGGQDVVVRWPPGFSARFEPQLVIYDAHRQRVAKDGDILRDASGDPDSNGRLATLMSFNGVDYPCQ